MPALILIYIIINVPILCIHACYLPHISYAHGEVHCSVYIEMSAREMYICMRAAGHASRAADPDKTKFTEARGTLSHTHCTLKKYCLTRAASFLTKWKAHSMSQEKIAAPLTNSPHTSQHESLNMQQCGWMEHGMPAENTGRPCVLPFKKKKVAWCLLSHIRVCTLGRRLGREWCCWHVSHSNTEDCLITGLGCHLSLCCRLITRSRRSLICVCVWWYEVDIPTVRATVYATALARLLAKMFGGRRIVEANVMCFPLC